MHPIRAAFHTLSSMWRWFPRLSIRFFVWALTWLGVYGASYYFVRVKHTGTTGKAQIHCTSRLAEFLFFPAITLEIAFGKLWDSTGQSGVDAQSFQEVLGQAGLTKRKVILALGTKSCLPCRQLERFFQEQKSILSRYFLVAKVNEDEDPQFGEAIHFRYRQNKGTSAKFRYYPWMAFLDGEGNTLVTSDDGPPGTIGIPQGGPADREWFLEMLKRSAPEISDAELKELGRSAERFHRRVWETPDSQD